jgi:hypothetical protein
MQLTSPSWLRRHFLTVIFGVTFVLLSMLVLEQGRTIDNQRSLIRQLFHDSLELQAARMRQARTSRQ